MYWLSSFPEYIRECIQESFREILPYKTDNVFYVKSVSIENYTDETLKNYDIIIDNTIIL